MKKINILASLLLTLFCANTKAQSTTRQQIDQAAHHPKRAANEAKADAYLIDKKLLADTTRNHQTTQHKKKKRFKKH